MVEGNSLGFGGGVATGDGNLHAAGVELRVTLGVGRGIVECQDLGAEDVVPGSERFGDRGFERGVGVVEARGAELIVFDAIVGKLFFVRVFEEMEHVEGARGRTLNQPSPAPSSFKASETFFAYTAQQSPRASCS